jgi:hypothetical protein
MRPNLKAKRDKVNVNRDATESVNLSGADDKIAKQSSVERSAKVARFAASVQRIVIVQSRNPAEHVHDALRIIA